MSRFHALILIAVLGTAPAGAPVGAKDGPPGAPPLVSAGSDRSDLAVTIYNDNLGLVKETRTLSLGSGRTELRFMDVAALIDPRTVHMLSVTAPRALQVLEQNYEYDLISPEKLLDKFIGRKVTLMFAGPDGDAAPEKRVGATLVSTTGGRVYEIGGEFHVNPPARVILPEIPGGLISVPTLVWLLDNSGPALHSVETSYLTGGLSWSADYASVVSADDAKVDLSGWVTIDNASGATYDDAKLKLVAGDIHRAQPEMKAAVQRMEMAMAPARPAMAEEAFFEYHLYTVDRPTTLKDRQTKQISLMEAAGVPVKKIYLLTGEASYYQARLGQLGTDLKVAVNLEMENSQKNGMGMPLPRGVVRLYKKDSSGSLQFIGEDGIKHTPKDERITLKVGDAFDVVADRTQVDFRAVGAARYDVEAEFEIKIRNHKDEPVTVTVREPVPGDWKVLTSTHTAVKRDAHTIEFSVPVAKDGESVLRYRVAVDWGG
jgi:hypothetical protein